MQVCLLLEKASTSGMHTYLCLYNAFSAKLCLSTGICKTMKHSNQQVRRCGLESKLNKPWQNIKTTLNLFSHSTKLGTPSLRHKTCRAELMFFCGTRICQVWHNIPCFHWWSHFSKGNSHEHEFPPWSLAHYRKVTVFLMLRGCISTSSAKQ